MKLPLLALCAAVYYWAAFSLFGEESYLVWSNYYNASADSADPDQDGFSNREEAAFGTDPNIPSSKISVQIQRTAGQVQLSWGTVSGIQYEIQASKTLALWSTVKEGIEGDGALASIDLSIDDFSFLRVHALLPLDQDDDGLNDYEESLVGTDPSIPDTDSDGLTDFDEYTSGSDPLDPSLSNSKPWHNLISAGNDDFSHAIRADGTLYSWGRRGGNGFKEDKLVPTAHIGKWTSISSSYGDGSVAIDSEGEVWFWEDDYEPQKVQFSDWQPGHHAIAVAAGGDPSFPVHGNFYLAVKNDGSLWVWGDSAVKVLGFGDKDNPTVPIQAPFPRIGLRWKSISAGYTHVVGISEDGRLWSWGENHFSKLGTGSLAEHLFTPTEVVTERDTHFVQVSVGSVHSVALAADGAIWVWGANNAGQLGTGAPYRDDRNTWIEGIPVKIDGYKWKAINAGIGSSAAISIDGALYTWGSNTEGLLGHGSKGQRMATPQQVGSRNDWQAVSSGERHSIALTNNGEVYVWGHSAWGNFGNGERSRKDFASTPQRIGDDNDWKTFATNEPSSQIGRIILKNNGELWGIGRGWTSEDIDWLAPKRIDTLSDMSPWSAVVHVGVKGPVVGRTINGEAFIWGSESFDEPTRIPGNWEQVFHRGYSQDGGFANALKSDGSLWALPWQFGQGFQSPKRLGAHTFVVVDGTGIAGYAINEVGHLYAWGGRDYLGISLEKDPTEPVLINDNVWLDVFVYDRRIFALKDDSSLWGFGNNHRGQLGDGTTNDRDRLIQLKGQNSDWKMVSLAYEHTIAVKNDGSLWGWGYNFYGQLGTGTQDGFSIPHLIDEGDTNGWTEVLAVDDRTFAIREDGSLWAWGRLIYDMLDSVPSKVHFPGIDQ